VLRLRRSQGRVRGAFDILNSAKLSIKDLTAVLKGNVPFFSYGEESIERWMRRMC